MPVRKRSNGTWSWYIELPKIEGKRKRKEKSGYKLKRDAILDMQKAQEELNNTGLIFDESEISVSDYFDFWLENYVMLNCRYGTQQRYKEIVKNHIKPSFGEYKLKDITPLILQLFFDNKFKDGYSQNSINSIHGVISIGFKMSVYPYQLRKENPCQYVNISRYNYKDVAEVVLTKKDMYKIFNYLDENNPYYAIVFKISFFCGLRKNECCGLTWDCIDLKNRLIHVKQQLIYKQGGEIELGVPKTKSSVRIVPFGQSLYDILIEHKKKIKGMKINNDFVCVKKNEKVITKTDMNYICRKINRDLIRFKFHSIRHLYSSILYEAGVDPITISENMGHKGIEITLNTYTHNSLNTRIKSIDLFEKHAIMK